MILTLFNPTVAFVYLATMLIVDFWYADGYREYGRLYTNVHLSKMLITAMIVGYLPTWTGTSIVANILISIIPMTIHTLTRICLDWYVGRHAAYHLQQGFTYER